MTPKERFDAALVEYDKTQDSAQHHDLLVWNITSLNWVGSALLMGFVLNALPVAETWLQKIPLLVISFVGIVLSSLVWQWARQMRAVKVAKYKRCQALELTLNMEQHTKLIYKKGTQTTTYSLLMMLFLLAWAVLVGFVIAA